MATRTARRSAIAVLPLVGFGGGLNLRDAWAQLDPSESPLCYNVVFDERGAVSARLGISVLNPASLLPAPPVCLYYSQIADALLAYISTDAGVGKLYSSTDGGVNWTAVYAGFSPSAQAAIVDFNNQVVVANTLDGVYSFPPTLAAPTHTAGGTNNMDEARGSTIAAWKNRVLVAGDPRNDTTHSPARLAASALADPTIWNDPTKHSWTNDLREIDDQTITAIGAGQGVDINQKPSLLVCKRNSMYRVNDSETGAYTTLHASGGGCASAAGLCSLLGRIVTINDIGLWVTDGIQVPERVSDKVAPLFDHDLDLSTLPQWSAGPHGDRALFNVTRHGSATNNFQIEFHPLYGWITVHKGMSLGPMAVYSKGVRRLLAASASGGKLYQVGTGGTDDATPIETFWSSKDYPLAGEREARLRSIRAWGRGSFQLGVRTDYQRQSADEFPFDYTRGGFRWDVDHWDQSTWGDIVFVSDEAQPLDAVGRNAQFAVGASVSSSSIAPPLLDDGTAPETGAWALYQMQLAFVGLGLD